MRDLRGADLSDADLRGADLSDADLSGADLSDADLSGADLSDADLSGAYLRGAYLRDAYLSDAIGAPPDHTDPSTPYARNPALGTDAERAAAYRMRHPDVPVIPQLDARILAALDAGGTLRMDAWHTCNTVHCRAGWAIHLAGEAGYALERKLGDPALAGRAIYRASTGRAPLFFATDEHALADIRRCAAEQTEPTP